MPAFALKTPMNTYDFRVNAKQLNKNKNKKQGILLWDVLHKTYTMYTRFT